MTVVLHWWFLPLAMIVGGGVLMMFTRTEGGMFPMPTWHSAVGALIIFAGFAVLLGGLIS